MIEKFGAIQSQLLLYVAQLVNSTEYCIKKDTQIITIKYFWEDLNNITMEAALEAVTLMVFRKHFNTYYPVDRREV